MAGNDQGSRLSDHDADDEHGRASQVPFSEDRHHARNRGDVRTGDMPLCGRKSIRHLYRKKLVQKAGKMVRKWLFCLLFLCAMQRIRGLPESCILEEIKKTGGRYE